MQPSVVDYLLKSEENYDEEVKTQENFFFKNYITQAHLNVLIYKEKKNLYISSPIYTIS